MHYSKRELHVNYGLRFIMVHEGQVTDGNKGTTLVGTKGGKGYVSEGR